MGTRADFYIGRGEKAEWLGSIAWDGYPEGIPKEILQCRTDDGFRNEVKNFLEGREDATTPDMGWPWPWEDSCTTDYAYAIHCGTVYSSCFGSEWFDPKKPTTDEEDEELLGNKKAVFPNMKDRQNVTMGSRSGLIVFTAT